MKNIVITTPVVLLKIKGNLKERASSSEFVEVATYENEINQTFIVSKVEEGVNLVDYRKRFLEELGISHNKLISLTYGEKGINFLIK